MKADREFIELAKTMHLEALARKTGRTPAGIRETARDIHQG